MDARDGSVGREAASRAPSSAPPTNGQPQEPPPHAPLIALDNTKAGMALVDKAKVEAVINEMSKDSPFYQNELRKKEQRKQRNDAIERHANSLTAQALDKGRLEADAYVAELERTRHLGQFVHIDMDMFYAAVEMKLNPSLRDVPMAVGGSSMLSTSNYEARKYGVRAAMPGYIAKKLCPQLVIVGSNFDAYRAEAETVRGILRQFDPDFSSGGMDEACLNVEPYCTEHMTSPADVARKIRAQIHEATQLTASAGIAPTATLSKICSNYNKPNGQYEMGYSRDDVMTFMRDLPVRSVPGIGKVSQELLERFEIKTCGDMFAARGKLWCVLGRKTVQHLIASSIGCCNSFCGFGEGSRYVRKSISQERTFLHLANADALASIAQKLCSDVAHSLQGESLVGKLVTIKMKFVSFEVKQKSVQLKRHSADAAVIESAVMGLLADVLSSFSNLRLLGVRVGELIAADDSAEGGAPAPTILDLFAKKKRDRTEVISVSDSEEESIDAVQPKPSPPLSADGSSPDVVILS